MLETMCCADFGLPTTSPMWGAIAVVLIFVIAQQQEEWERENPMTLQGYGTAIRALAEYSNVCGALSAQQWADIECSLHCSTASRLSVRDELWQNYMACLSRHCRISEQHIANVTAGHRCRVHAEAHDNFEDWIDDLDDD